MSKVLKFIHAETTGAAPFARDELELFPDAEQPVFAFDVNGPADEPDADEEIAVDPEVVRQEIMEEARVEAERKVQEAYQEGLERGRQAGQEAFEATLAECEKALLSAGDQLRKVHESYLERLEPQVVDLVKKIATQVVNAELRSNPKIIHESVSRALRLFTDEHIVTLALNPQDLEAIRHHKVELLDNFPAIASLTLSADDSVAPGGCVAYSKTTEVDARIETVLAQVLDGLTE